LSEFKLKKKPRAWSIYFRFTNCASTIRGRGLIINAVYFIQQATRVVLII